MRTSVSDRLTRSKASLVTKGQLTRDSLAERLFPLLDAFAPRTWQLALLRAGLRVENALSVSKRFLPIVWLDTCEPADQLVPEQVGIAVGPNIDGKPVTTDVVIPAVRLHRLSNVTINPLFTAFVSERDVILERITSVDTSRCLFLSGHSLIEEGRHVAGITEVPPSPLRSGFFLSGNGYWNYYHWMIEILPKLRYWQRLPSEVRDAYPLLVGERVFRYPSMLEALALFCGEPNIRRVNDGETYRVDHLLHINAPTVSVFNLREDEREKVTDSVVRPEVIHDWRQRVGLPQCRSKGRRRLFLARSGDLRTYNQAEVIELFTTEGFDVMRLEHMTLQAQIDAISAAELIAGPAGAGWTNLIFCMPGTRALSWLPEESKDASIYSTIAAIVGVDLRYVTYRTGARSSAELYLANYRLDLSDMRRALAALLASTPVSREAGVPFVP